jgi:hypothetical protein
MSLARSCALIFRWTCATAANAAAKRASVASTAGSAISTSVPSQTSARASIGI